MRPPTVYTAYQIKHWDTEKSWTGPTGNEGGWRPLRPEPGPMYSNLIDRLMIAWLVFTGEYYALDWSRD